jgi:hypothetical protein
MSPNKLKNRSLQVQSEEKSMQPSSEADLIELDILQAADNLSKYQKETRKWRDKKVVKREISISDSVLKRKPNDVTIGKLQ